MAKKRPRPKAKQSESQIEKVTSDPVNNAVVTTPSVSKTVAWKICRLCESQDGPFLNIFDSDTTIIKKMKEIMPFPITENDSFPQKICFRCSAKVEELYEFLRKCIKTQQNLWTQCGKTSPFYTKRRSYIHWENKFVKKNLNKDDMCNVLIQKAIEAINGIPPNLFSAKADANITPASKKLQTNSEQASSNKGPPESSKTTLTFQSDDDSEEINIKQVKLNLVKCDQIPPPTRTRSSKADIVDGLPDPPRKQKTAPLPKLPENIKITPIKIIDNKLKHDTSRAESVNKTPPVTDNKTSEPVKVTPKAPEPPPFNIMDHVSVIKVNSVGTLYLCKLCNRNFLKKEVVYTHGCAKNNVPKDNIAQKLPAPPQAPKPSTVKYIKINTDTNKPVNETNKEVPKKADPPHYKVNIPIRPETKPKPKAGPASKVHRTNDVQTPQIIQIPEPQPTPKIVPPENNPVPPVVPTLNFPGIPSLNSRYKLVSGPNNIFTLVEESANNTEDAVLDVGTSRKRMAPGLGRVGVNIGKNSRDVADRDSSPELVIDDVVNPPQRVEQPYPVGLIQTVPHPSGIFVPTSHPAPPSFTTPPTKKHSYTVVQTGNPSKLLISSKPQPTVEEPKKKSRKSKLESKDVSNEHINVSAGNSGPSKEGFFAFVNVDPVTQPTYVLPTDNTIQESQISTTQQTPASKGDIDRDKYTCNMCNEKFSREKKLLAHIQSHYNQMDQEDQVRAVKAPSKKKTRKS